MSARAFTALALAAALLGAAPARARAVDAFTVHFLDGQDQVVQLNAARSTIAYDADDNPLFEADLDYIRAYAENPSGRVYEWNPHRARVRITPPGAEAVWLKCADLAPMTIACGPRLQVQGAVVFVGEGEVPDGLLPPAPPAPPPAPGASPYGTVSHGTGTGKGHGYAAAPGPGRGIPVCPGDPRCKKVKGG